MLDINTNTYVENCIHAINAFKKDNKSVLWIKIRDIQDKSGVENMSDVTIESVKAFITLKLVH